MITIIMPNYEQIAELVKAISTILWPIVTLIIILIFKKDISLLIQKIKKGEIFGSKFDFNESINNFEANVEKVENKIPFKEPNDRDIESSQNNDKISHNIDIEIINETSKDPKIGLIRLAIEIEKQLKELMYTTGWVANTKRFSVRESFDFLTSNGIFPTNVMSSIEIFWDLRNKIIHGSNSVNNNEIIRVIDIGMVLLNTINSIPREIFTVHKTDIDLFSDPECRNKISFGKGLMLEVTSPDKKKHYIVYPTTKSNYIIGKRVSYEWSFDNKWDKCYYVYPETNDPKMAWSQSAEFIGRHIESL